MKTKLIMLIALSTFSFQLSTFNCFSQTFQTLTDTNVIFHDYIPDVVVSNPYVDTLKIDINQDGINDLQFYLHYSPATSAYVKSLSNGCKTAFFIQSNTNDSLTSNSLIWVSGDRYWASSMGYQNRLGVIITVGTDNYYGWVQVTYSTGPIAFTIDKYAFCKIANYPFLYGQTSIGTGINEIIATDSTQVFINDAGNLTVQSGKIINSVTLTSVTGVVVVSQNNINSYSANISTAGITHGTYIVQVQFADLSVYTKQIIL